MNIKKERLNNMLWDGIGEGDSEKVNLALILGAEVDNVGVVGMTPLHKASFDDFADVAQILISAGGNINAKNNWGQTPLYLAKSEEMKHLLEENGATI
jgi:ankyrin repeat protein